MELKEHICEKCGYDVRYDDEIENEEFSWKVIDYLKDLGTRIASFTL